MRTVAIAAAAILAAALATSPAWADKKQPFPVYFGFNSSKLSDDALFDFDDKMADAKKCTVTHIDVVGHTDTAEDHANLVSYARALKVRDVLTKDYNIPADKIMATSASATQPAKQTPPKTNEPLNRRAEVTVTCA